DGRLADAETCSGLGRGQEWADERVRLLPKAVAPRYGLLPTQPGLAQLRCGNRAPRRHSDGEVAVHVIWRARGSVGSACKRQPCLNATQFLHSSGEHTVNLCQRLLWGNGALDGDT